jgi:hypothetical protein
MKCIRCLLTALLLLVIGGGIGFTLAQGDNMPESAMEVAVDQGMLAGCDRCDGSDMAMTAGACSAFGTCVQGFVALTDTNFVMPGRSISPSHYTKHLGGLRGSPDPFPPKPLARA